LLCCILKESCNLQGTQGDFAGAALFAEEAYNCAAVAYNPVHPQVQNAAGLLIQSLTHAGNLKDAVCMNIYIYIYMYVFIYIHIFYEINICIYICIDIYIYVLIYIYVTIYGQKCCVNTYINIYINSNMGNVCPINITKLERPRV
jgi:hypothetical protein